MNTLNLSDILFSKVRQRVLGLLYSCHECSYHTNEIIRLTKSGTGAVQRELEALRSIGLITVKSIGNQKHYAANQHSVLFTELRSIILKTFGLADVIKRELMPIFSEVQLSFVYGSIAKQEDNKNSDIDLMLICDNLTYADLFVLLEKAEVQLARTINPTFYTAEEWKRKKANNNNFVLQIIKQPKIFLKGTENELNKLGESS